jgi:hypothetical protein
MKLALQPARRNLRAEPAYPNASACVQCASIDSASSTFRTLAKASPVPSYSYKLFVVSKEVKSFAIKQIHTLSQKHPGGGRGHLPDIDQRVQSATPVNHLESTLAKVYQNKGL